MSTKLESRGQKLTDDPEYFKKWYEKNKEKQQRLAKEYRKKNKKSISIKKKQYDIKYKERRAELIKLHGAKCMDCNKKFHQDIFDFHHRIPSEKGFEINMRSMSKSWEKIMIEASKCDLLCKNCHTLRHILMKERHYNESREIRKSN